MPDEKQIEEMAVVCGDCENSCDECFSEYEKVIWKHKIKTEDRAKHCQAILHAQRLYNAGYRKIPENAVVLTKEEHERLTSRRYVITPKRKLSPVEIILAERNNPFVVVTENIDITPIPSEDEIRKKTAREIFDTIIKALEEQKERVKAFYGVPESVGADVAIRTVKELTKQYGVEV